MAKNGTKGLKGRKGQKRAEGSETKRQRDRETKRVLGRNYLCPPGRYVSLSQKKDEQLSLLVLKTLCLTLPDYRTFIDDYLKILDFIDWFKVAYPEKAGFLTEET